MNKVDVERIVEKIKCLDYRFEIIVKPVNVLFLVARYEENDIATGKPSIQTTRKWYISPHMVESEIVQTALACVLMSMEHRAREGFKYFGQRVFSPHFDIEVFEEAARNKRFDYRK